MNALYRLRLHLRQEETGDLEIHPLSNRVRPYHRGEEGLTLCDPLADYYLDMGQLEGVDREDVEALLNGFDRFMAVRDQRAEALAVLGLVEPVDDAAIRRRYRELAMAYHPDRGGDGERLKAINQAMGLLRPR